MEFSRSPWLRIDEAPASPRPAVVRARLLAARARGTSKHAVLAAHARLEAGMWGICTRCGGRIASEALVRDPTRTLCGPCTTC